MEAHKSSSHKLDITQVFKASQFFTQSDIVEETPLLRHDLLSSLYGAEILLKREDRQLGISVLKQATPSKLEAPTTNT